MNPNLNSAHSFTEGADSSPEAACVPVKAAQVLPWHRKVADILDEHAEPYSGLGANFMAETIAAHDPQEPPLFTSRVLVPQLRAEIEQLRKQHAETVRLLELALEMGFDDSGYDSNIRYRIRAHLATLQPATAEKKGTQ